MWKRLTSYIILLAMALSPILLCSPMPVTGWDLNPFSVNITITVRPAAGPEITNGIGASSITYNSARLNGEVTVTGGANPDVTIFLGLADGGMDPLSWSDNVPLGALSLGTFYHDVYALSENTTYYYRCYAENAYGADWADSTANFTTGIAPLSPPSGFTLADLGAVTVTANWSLGAKSTYTLIRCARNDYPTDITAGELIYYGPAESVNATGYALESHRYCFSAWGFAADNITFSTEYSTAEIGGEGMTNISVSMDSLTAMLGTVGELGFGAFLVIGLLALASWRQGVVWRSAAGLACVIIGLNWVNLHTGIAWATIALGTFQLLQGVLDAVSSDKPSKGISQFKDMANTIKGWF